MISSKIAKRIQSALDEMDGKERGWALLKKKLFGLPSPIELGWSSHNALEDEEFSDEPKGKTWQDWHRHVKQLHPTKYFVVETLPKFFRYNVWWPIKRPIEKAHYWTVSHVIPSRRYHWLDLRQKGGYQYGWNDVPEKMLYAMFNLLGEYLNKEQPYDLSDDYTDEQINADEALKHQQGNLSEARAIYHWWTVGRKQEEAAEGEMRTLWWNAKKAKDPKKEEYWKQLQQMKEDYETKTDEMIARLMKIRRGLWT
jgi:hypothetical protein